ncbi:MAG: acetyl-CoA carboxylase [Hyphomicrobium sp.]
MAVRTVLSHLPGIFYSRPSPDEPVFKAPGDAVTAGDVIGLIELMKSFNEVRSDVSGKLVRYLAESGDEIMPGQPIAEIEG